MQIIDGLKGCTINGRCVVSKRLRNRHGNAIRATRCLACGRCRLVQEYWLRRGAGCRCHLLPDLTGKIIAGRTVLRHAGNRPSGGALWLVQCLKCRKEQVCSGNDLRNRPATCHCQAMPTGAFKHGQCRTTIWRRWSDMKGRVTSRSGNRTKYYIDKGVTVCARWRESFVAFAQDMGPMPTPQHTLGRIDHSQGYGPGNCLWQTWADQMAAVHGRNVIAPIGF